MLIFPAIDLLNAECVRLTQGDYKQSQTYAVDPLTVAKQFANAGAKFLHIVDLDAARNGKSDNYKLIKKMVQEIDLSVQVGGGIRSLAAAENLISSGVDRLIIGTAAIKQPKLLQSLIIKYGPERIIVSVDAKADNILVEGWLEAGNKNLTDFLIELKQVGIQTIIYTDIQSDGMLAGPNFTGIKKVLVSGLNVIVAGGVSSQADLEKLKKLGVYGAIIGKALYEQKVDLAEVVASCQISNLTKRVIPCLDIADGRVVKGVNFINLQDAGDPVELAKYYCQQGADELVFLDITATNERRKTLKELVKKIAAKINIPFTVGGGINSLADIEVLLKSGADKISLGSAAVRNPELISEAATKFGSQCIVISIDARQQGESWNAYIAGGQIDSGIDAIELAQLVESKGAGELLVNSLDRDGTQTGYDLELLQAIKTAVKIPVIASSGAGKLSDFADAINIGQVDAVLAASVFHSGQIQISKLKKYLTNQSCN